ncbi:hypothetical protein [Thalassotalea eurytherma]|uniref:Organic solvent tolerance-like N-terminal domain-containing protein n=1 Tax=Thalassotalea eurytherma TaxID=1144278 RepID=A0ABQ6GZ83_9GAMM|nr:hypothetical protein [Thalassotalea eurytherma]GLX81253.1 hypothetical protein theurythT_07050 [Thalassotalea eurytherma]
MISSIVLALGLATSPVTDSAPQAAVDTQASDEQVRVGRTKVRIANDYLEAGRTKVRIANDYVEAGRTKVRIEEDYQEAGRTKVRIGRTKVRI